MNEREEILQERLLAAFEFMPPAKQEMLVLLAEASKSVRALPVLTLVQVNNVVKFGG